MRCKGVFLAAAMMVLAGVCIAEEDMAPVGDLKVHRIFNSNMVIQRSKPVDVWGWSTSGDKIIVTFAGQTVTGTTGEDRSWKVTLPAAMSSGSSQVKDSTFVSRGPMR